MSVPLSLMNNPLLVVVAQERPQEQKAGDGGRGMRSWVEAPCFEFLLAVYTFSLDNVILESVFLVFSE